MSDFDEKENVYIESMSWRMDLKKWLNEFSTQLKSIFPEYEEDFIFTSENIDKVFAFYKDNCYHQLKELLPKKQEGTLDRHKVVSAYIISFLVKENEVFSFNWEKHHNEQIPFPLIAANEIFLVDFARSFLREFIMNETRDSGFTGRSLIPNYDIFLPNVESKYEYKGEQRTSDFYDNFVKLLMMIKQGLSSFEGEKISQYPLIPTILLLANDLYLLEAVSDCAKFNLGELYYKQKN
jgi:hypothetical protein